MKVLKKGILARRNIRCHNCYCEFEIDGNDIHREMKILIPTEENSFKTAEPSLYYVKCPECDEKIVLLEIKKEDKQQEEYDNPLKMGTTSKQHELAEHKKRFLDLFSLN